MHKNVQCGCKHVCVSVCVGVRCISLCGSILVSTVLCAQLMLYAWRMHAKDISTSLGSFLKGCKHVLTGALSWLFIESVFETMVFRVQYIVKLLLRCSGDQSLLRKSPKISMKLRLTVLMFRLFALNVYEHALLLMPFVIVLCLTTEIGYTYVCVQMYFYIVWILFFTQCVSTTPLHIAAEMSHYDVVAVLLSYNADATIKDKVSNMHILYCNWYIAIIVNLTKPITGNRTRVI